MTDTGALADAGVRVETPPVEVLGAVRATVGESPLWSADEAAWWWVDIEGRTLHRQPHGGGGHETWRLPERLACIALHGDGGLLAAMETGIFRLGPQPGGAIAIARIADAAHPRPGMRFNDGRCDRQGRFWVTSMVRDMALADRSGALYRLDGDGLSPPLVDGLVTGNGLAFSPDGRSAYLSDSHPSVQRVWRFDVGVDGTLANRREFVDMNRHPGRPDGAAVDAEGGYWTCANDAGLLLRFTPAGELDRALALPVAKPSMCAFGGPALDIVAVTSIVPAAPVAGFDAGLAGATLLVHPGVRGIAETPYAFH